MTPRYRFPDPLDGPALERLVRDPRHADRNHPEHAAYMEFLSSAFLLVYPRFNGLESLDGPPPSPRVVRGGAIFVPGHMRVREGILCEDGTDGRERAWLMRPTARRTGWHDVTVWGRPAGPV